MFSKNQPCVIVFAVLIALVPFTVSVAEEPDLSSFNADTLRKLASNLYAKVERMEADLESLGKQLRDTKSELKGVTQERDELAKELEELKLSISKDPEARNRLAKAQAVARAISEREIMLGMTKEEAHMSLGGSQKLVSSIEGEESWQMNRYTKDGRVTEFLVTIRDGEVVAFRVIGAHNTGSARQVPMNR
ncbi:MAG: hypothetical protein GC164_16570 [Phycisphaera sp.]|nr:hypothetical protein [Phycisphaera sp.]